MATEEMTEVARVIRRYKHKLYPEERDLPVMRHEREIAWTRVHMAAMKAGIIPEQYHSYKFWGYFKDNVINHWKGDTLVSTYKKIK